MGLWGCPELSNPGQLPASLLMKIHNVLGEFEEYSLLAQSPYSEYGHKEFKKPPVAIVSAREYIFSENIGILSDIAAGNEQTFGTLSLHGHGLGLEENFTMAIPTSSTGSTRTLVAAFPKLRRHFT